jgi:hypothetical protein
MRRSTRTAIITSLLISTTVGAAFALLMPSSISMPTGQIDDLKHQIAVLSDDNRRLNDAVSQLQLIALGEDRGQMQPDGEVAQMALTTAAAAETRRVTDAASQAAATSEALEARFDEQRRLLFIQTPQCKKPNVEGLIVCEITMRNNADQALLVSFSQSGSRAVLTPEATFSSIRMRQLGQTRFNYTATATIPAQGTRSIEIAFGPAKSAPEAARSIALSVNKMTYEFADVALND